MGMLEEREKVLSLTLFKPSPELNGLQHVQMVTYLLLPQSSQHNQECVEMEEQGPGCPKGQTRLP